MFELRDFYEYHRQNDVPIIPFPGMPAPGATIRDNRDGAIAVFLDPTKLPTLRMLRGVCMHENGHTATGALHKCASPYETVERAEHRAVRYTAERYLTAEDFNEAFQAGYTELWQLAEWFDLPEPDVAAAYHFWKEARGVAFGSGAG